MIKKKGVAVNIHERVIDLIPTFFTGCYRFSLDLDRKIVTRNAKFIIKTNLEINSNYELLKYVH